MAEDHFAEKSHELLMDKQYFKKVDALEMFTDYWSYGRSMKSMPMHNLYVPTAHTIMPRPKFKEYDIKDLVAGQSISHRTKDLHTPQPGSKNIPNTLKPTGLANWTEDKEYRSTQFHYETLDDPSYKWRAGSRRLSKLRRSASSVNMPLKWQFSTMISGPPMSEEQEKSMIDKFNQEHYETESKPVT